MYEKSSNFQFAEVSTDNGKHAGSSEKQKKWGVQNDQWSIRGHVVKAMA